MVRFGAVANSIPAAISTIRPMATTARKSLSICANAGRVWAFLLDHRRQKLLIRKLIRKQTHARSPMPPLALQSDGGCAGVFLGRRNPGVTLATPHNVRSSGERLALKCKRSRRGRHKRAAPDWVLGLQLGVGQNPSRIESQRVCQQLVREFVPACPQIGPVSASR